MYSQSVKHWLHITPKRDTENLFFFYKLAYFAMPVWEKKVTFQQELFIFFVKAFWQTCVLCIENTFPVHFFCSEFFASDAHCISDSIVLAQLWRWHKTSFHKLSVIAVIFLPQFTAINKSLKVRPKI